MRSAIRLTGTSIVDAAKVTYEPDANYCNRHTPDDTFTYTLSGGSTATVSVDVKCVDDLPVAVDDSSSSSRTPASNDSASEANDTDVDGGRRRSSRRARGHSRLGHDRQERQGRSTTTPDPDFCIDGPGPDDSFTYTLNGGSSATVSMNIKCTSDDPRTGHDGRRLRYAENDLATAGRSRAITVSDPDGAGARVTSATIEITGNYAGAEDVLALQQRVHPPDDPVEFAGDTLTLTGEVTMAERPGRPP